MIQTSHMDIEVLKNKINSIAIWSITPNGKILGRKIRSQIQDSVLFVSTKIWEKGKLEKDVRKYAAGPLKGATVDMEALKKEFFKTVGWDLATGDPTVEKMTELGINAESLVVEQRQRS